MSYDEWFELLNLCEKARKSRVWSPEDVKYLNALHGVEAYAQERCGEIQYALSNLPEGL